MLKLGWPLDSVKLKAISGLKNHECVPLTLLNAT